MPRIRSVHPSLFTDSSFLQASMQARLFMIGLWTQAFDDGVFNADLIELKVKLFPLDDVDVGKLLDELEDLNVIKRFSTGTELVRNWGGIRNFKKFQSPKKPNSSGHLPKELCTYIGFDDESFGQISIDISKPKKKVPNQYGTGSVPVPTGEERRGGERKGVKKTPSLRSGEKNKSQKRATRLPDDWKPTQDYFEAAYKLGLRYDQAEHAIAKFKDYWIAKSGKDATKRDWLATWRNWCRKDVEHRNANQNKTSPHEKLLNAARLSADQRLASPTGRYQDDDIPVG